MHRFLILCAIILSFIAGGVVVYIALEPRLKPPISAAKRESTPAQISQKNQKILPFVQPIQRPVYSNKRKTQSIDPIDLPEITDALRTNFVEAHQFVSGHLDTTQLPSLLNSLGAKVLIYSFPFEKENEWLEPKAELIEGSIGYLRLTHFKENSIKRLTQTFQSWKKKNIPLKGLILDLRRCGSINDFEGASDIASLFISPRIPLFQIQFPQKQAKFFESHRQPLSLGKETRLIILTGPHTTGAAEVLAFILRERAHAFIIGLPTPGEMAFYKETPLKSGKFLRQASALILNNEGKPIIDIPILPDIHIDIQETEETAVFQQSYMNGAETVLAELDISKRLNEASLIKEEDVELNEMMDAQKNKNKPAGSPVLIDLALQASVDILKALEWQTFQTQQIN